MKCFPLAFAICLLACVNPALASEASLDGILRDTSGAPMPNTQIDLQNGTGAVVKTTRTDALGHYAFSSVPTGSYVLMATQNNSVLGSALVSTTSGQDVHKDINLADKQTMNVVIAQRRQARNDLSPQTGTNAYVIDQQTIDSLPQGEDTPLDKVMLQMPGVTEDSAASGLLHIRGEHANVQYRLNGILLPEGILGLGDVLDSHIIESATLLDGALPAQYGFRTAGVMDINTKTGFQNGGNASVMVGSNGTFQQSADYAGVLDNVNYFVSGSHLSSNLGIENPTASANAIHDHTEQNKEFGYADYLINEMQHVEIAAGNAISYFQIPNNPNQPVFQTANSQNVANPTNLNSANINERQFESNQFMTAAWQGSNDGVTVQIAPYIRNSETHFRPDDTGDLIFDGLASDVQYTDLVTGLQNDNSWRLNSEHTLRAGLTIQNDHVQSNTSSLAYSLDGSGNLIPNGSGGDQVTSIVNNHTKDGQLYGSYLQDEWKLTNALTMNYGARFDDMEQYVSANQLSPRLGFVYKATDTTTLHLGYARYFTPPPMELVSNTDIAAFNNTTGQSAVTQDSPVKPERTNSFDAGVSQKLGDRWLVGADGYYKQSHDLLDEGQFGTALILTPFNYLHGQVYGSELTATYTGDKLKAYGNFAYSRAMGEDVSSAQFNFSSQQELDFISNHWINLDHGQTYTASAGATYDVLKDTTVGLDSHLGSGLRDGFANTSHLPAYVTFDASAEQKLNLFPHDETAVRLSVVNLLDSVYELRNGTGIGVGAPQYGARRGIFLTLAQKF